MLGTISLGNFVNRVVKFIQAKFDSVLPDSQDPTGPYPIVDPQDPDLLDPTFAPEVNQLLSEYIEAMEAVKLRLGLQIVMQISNRGNQYLQRAGLGNALLARPKACAQVLSRAINLIYTLSALVHPFMPGTSKEILEQINAPARTVPLVLSNDILTGHRLGAPAYLFTKIDEKKADEWRVRFGGEVVQASAAKPEAKVAKKKGGGGGGGKKPDVPKKTTNDGPKSEAVIALEAQVKAQGEVVRKLKEAMKKPDANDKPQKEDLDIAVAELLRLKSSLLEAQEPSEVAA